MVTGKELSSGPSFMLLTFLHVLQLTGTPLLACSLPSVSACGWCLCRSPPNQVFMHRRPCSLAAENTVNTEEERTLWSWRCVASGWVVKNRSYSDSCLLGSRAPSPVRLPSRRTGSAVTTAWPLCALRASRHPCAPSSLPGSP